MTSQRQRKAGFELPDPVLGWPLMDICLKIPDAPEYRRAFLGHIYKLGLWAAWEKSYLPGDTRAKEAGQLWRDVLNAYLDMGCNDVNCCCDNQIPVQYRYSPAGILQRSTDGGTTWDDAPEYDPRVYSPQFPPMTGPDAPDKRCLAATGAVALIKEQIGDQLTDDMSRYALGQLITDWVKTMLQSSNPFQALLTVVTNQIFALVIAVLRPALTDTVYDTFKCILNCDMSDDASFTQTQVEQVIADIGDQIDGVAALFFQQLVNLLGTTGLTNLARAGGATTGDCSTCECNDFWCFDGNFTVSSYGSIFSGLDVTGGQNYNTVWTSGIGWQTTNASPNYSVLVWKMDDIPGLRYLKFTMTDNGDVTVDGRGDSLHGTFTEHYQNPDVGLTWDGSPTNPYHMYGKRSTPIISAFHAEGVGPNPFGGDNCEPEHLP